MGEEDRTVITISCPSHHQTLVDRLSEFFVSKHRVDCNFRWGGRSIRAHRLIVEALLPPDTIGQRKTWTAALPTTGHLETLLEFMYKGQVTIQRQHLGSLLSTAKLLNFQMLVEAASEVFEKSDDGDSGETGGKTSVGNRRKVTPVKIGNSHKPTRTPRAAVVDNQPSRQTRARAAAAAPSVKAPAENLNDDAVTEEPLPENDSDGETDKSAEESKRPVKRKGGRTKSAAASEKLLECDLCDFRTLNTTSLSFHRLAKHDPEGKSFRCQPCNRRFAREDLYRRHHCHPRPKDAPVYRCPHCPFKANRKFRLHGHLPTHDPNLVLFKCDDCSRPFLTRELLERHLLTHRTYSCRHCDYQTKASWRYYSHLTTRHRITASGKPIKGVSCAQCSFTCLKRRDLLEHMVTEHSHEKPFKCSQCPYSAARKNQVVRHERVAHLGIKPELCEECGFRTDTPFKLDQHRRKHDGCKPYKCEICSQTFAHNSSLKVHSGLHLADSKPYSCHACGRTFKRRDHLNTHLRGVHKIVDIPRSRRPVPTEVFAAHRPSATPPLAEVGRAELDVAQLSMSFMD